MTDPKVLDAQEKLADFLKAGTMNGQEMYVSICKCGYLTFGFYGAGHDQLILHKDNLEFINTENSNTLYNCNSCINDWNDED